MRALTLAALLGFTLLSPLVRASDDWSDETRRLEVDARADGFEVRSERATGDVRDRIRLRLEGDNVRFRFEFQRDVGATEVDAELRVEIERVIEFQDLDADGVFGGSDVVRAEYGPSDLTLGAVSPENVSAGGVPGLRVTASYSFRDEPSSGLTFRVVTFGDLTAFQGFVQHPVEIKADIVFSDFPFLEPPEPDTLPGIVFRVVAASPTPPTVTADGVSIDAGGLQATFRWKDTAVVDGNETRVGVSVSENPGQAGEQDLTVAFAYARGTNIVHDPTFGFLKLIEEAAGRILGDIGLYALGAVAAMVTFSGLAWARKVRKVKRE